MPNLAGGAIKASVPFQLYRRLAMGGDGVAVKTITGDVTVTDRHEEFLVLNGGVATRIVTLPTVAQGAKKGHVHCIRNAGTTNDLTVNRPAATLLVTLNPGEFALVVHDGTIWQVAANSSNPTFDILAGTNVYTGTNNYGATGIRADVVAEYTANAGVTVDGTLIKDGVVTAALTGNATTATEATGLRAASVYSSIEQTGNGAEQIYAHGLVTTPVVIIATATAGHNGAGAAGTQAVTITYGVMSATELRFTVSSGAKYRIVAIK